MSQSSEEELLGNNTIDEAINHGDSCIKALEKNEFSQYYQTAENTSTEEELIKELNTNNILVIANYKPGSSIPIFNYDSAAIKSLVNMMNNSEENSFELVGHTNSLGAEDQNYIFSMKRADNALCILISFFELDQHKVVTNGQGEGNPIADNDTKEGRSKNSRLEIKKQ